MQRTDDATIATIDALLDARPQSNVTPILTNKTRRKAGHDGLLIEVGPATEWEWWAEGRKAHRDEVEESIRSGIPALEEVARLQEGGMEALQRQIADFYPYLPPKE